jgi:hypothetical protein
MSEQTIQLLIITGLPLLTIVFCWLVLMVTMRKTTGELKYWLTPENIFKIISLIFILITTLTLSFLKIISGELSGSIISGIVGYSFGYRFFKNDKE